VLRVRAVLGDGEEGRVSEELAVLDQLVDADDLLLDDASGPHVEVSDFRRAF
jgi:hypothetical protein